MRLLYVGVGAAGTLGKAAEREDVGHAIAHRRRVVDGLLLVPARTGRCLIQAVGQFAPGIAPQVVVVFAEPVVLRSGVAGNQLHRVVYGVGNGCIVYLYVRPTEIGVEFHELTAIPVTGHDIVWKRVFAPPLIQTAILGNANRPYLTVKHHEFGTGLVGILLILWLADGPHICQLHSISPWQSGSL